jgi:DAK2 domain fusion protein YloV
MTRRANSVRRADAETTPSVTKVFGAQEIVATMLVYRDALHRHQATLNRLNVFPVPDGDTGTNMLLTLEAVCRELAEHPGGNGAGGAQGSIADVCGAIAHGSLMGARGNSGVILCQVLRGISTTFAPLAAAGGPDFALALECGSRAARAAVLRPTEGTILTVAALAARAAATAVEAHADLVAVLDAARDAAVEALWSTPSLLAVLAEAGVVDAGGAGLVLFYDALCNVADGRPMPDELELPGEVARLVAVGPPPSAVGPPIAQERAEGLSPRYEVMCFLSAADELVPAFKDVWAGLGDSIVVVGGDGLWNCHIHTDDVGAAIEAALDAGRPREIRVTDLAEQVEEERWVRQAVATRPVGPPLSPDGVPVTAVVAVGTGEGIHRIFYSLGARYLVAGGQSMNPSTRDILEVIESTPAQQVVVLPNNSNIIPVARQAAEIATKAVFVVPTRGVQEGFAALLEYDPSSSGEDNARLMEEAAHRVVAGEVTQAVRATSCAAGKVAVGDFIGLSRAGIESVGKGLADATIGLLAVLLGPGHEIVTLVQGEGSTAADTRQVTEWLRAVHPEITVELHHGGQPLYPYLVSIE